MCKNTHEPFKKLCLKFVSFPFACLCVCCRGAGGGGRKERKRKKERKEEREREKERRIRNVNRMSETNLNSKWFVFSLEF